MSILDKIIKDKHKEIQLKKTVFPVSQFEKLNLFKNETISLKENLSKSKTGIIAEHKRRSPSRSLINNSFSVSDVVNGYETAGASGVSVLTDGKYFGGSLDDLLIARAACNLPILRKEFIIDEYQILESKAYGADAILLIAAVLTRDEIKKLSSLSKQLNLEILLEIHNEEELDKSLIPNIDMIGVNNRNLKNFEINIERSKQLSGKIPPDFLKVSESGISNVETIIELKKYGFKSFLVGENFMKTENPGLSAREFIDKLS